MSISNINPSPLYQWLQNSLSVAGLSGNPQTAGASSGSPFQQALQTMTSQTAPPADPQQLLSANEAQGIHHHHRHHSGGEGNNQGNEGFIDQLAQSIVNDLQQIDGTGDSSTASSSSDSTGNDLSFLDGLTSALANNSLTQYQQTTDAGQASNPSSLMNTIA